MAVVSKFIAFLAASKFHLSQRVASQTWEPLVLYEIVASIHRMYTTLMVVIVVRSALSSSRGLLLLLLLLLERFLFSEPLRPFAPPFFLFLEYIFSPSRIVDVVLCK